MPLPTRRIGPFTVSAVGLGCMNLSHGYRPRPDAAGGAALLNRALDLGCTLLDTAAIYGDGANERLLGDAVAHRRRDFTLASKCVLDAVGDSRMLDGRPERIKTTCEAALRRLRTDVIDLYYLHRLDRDVPIEESAGALAELIAEGKIRAAGLSEMSAPVIRRAHAVVPIAAVQTEYSPMTRNPEVAVLDACRALGIAFVAFSPVGRGLLAGGARDGRFAADDMRGQLPRFTGAALAANLPLIARFDALAAACGATPAQLAIGWLLARGDDIVPIPGTTSLSHLAENLAAAERMFDAETVAAVDALLPPNALTGARYSAAMQAMVDTETLPGEELSG